MYESPVNPQTLIATILLAAGIIILSLIFGKSRNIIVFCDVGQGDATYIHIYPSVDIIIDAGPDNSVLQCLGNNMFFADRTIEYAILTHPDKDHYGGFPEIIRRYRVKHFISVPLKDASPLYSELISLLHGKRISTEFVYAHDSLNLSGTKFIFLWPSREYIRTHAVFENGERFGTAVLDDNNYSLTFLFQKDDFRVIMTGDIPISILHLLPEQYVRNVSILKIPHHGSKQGASRSFYKLADPTIGVISVGKHNTFGHPSNEVLDSLHALGIKIKRTDENGDLTYQFK